MKKPITHGTQAGYKRSCRCDDCVAIKRAVDKAYYERTSTRPKRVSVPVEEQKRRAVERAAAWKKANPEKHKANTARYRDKYRERRRADSLIRYYKQMEENPEKVREQRRKNKNTDKGRAYQRIANYRRRSLPMSKEVRDWWLALKNPLCAYCNSALATEIDHVIPVTRGGTNESDNLVAACRRCNARKNNKTAEEFLAALKGA